MLCVKQGDTSLRSGRLGTKSGLSQLASFIMLNKILNFSGRQFLHLENGRPAL